MWIYQQIKGSLKNKNSPGCCGRVVRPLANQMVATSILVQGTGPNHGGGRQPIILSHIYVSTSFFLPPLPSKNKKWKIIFSE